MSAADVLRRNPRAELDWLADLARAADRQGVEHPAPGSFAGGVTVRLGLHGAQIRARPAHELLREINEELLDVAGWTLVALQTHRTRLLRPALAHVVLHAYAGHAILAGLEVDGR